MSFLNCSKRLFAATVLILSMSTWIFAEPKAVIDLTVLDEKTNKFFPGAKVLGTFVDESGKEMNLQEKVTDARGQYLDFVSVNGKFVLTVSAAGYQTTKVEGEVKGTDVRVSRRIRNKIVLKRELAPVPSAAQTAPTEPQPTVQVITPQEPSGVVPPHSVAPLKKEEILSETGWDEKGLQTNILNSLISEDGYLGTAHSKLKTAPLQFQESFLRGLLNAAKFYLSSESFAKDYTKARTEWYGIKENAEDPNMPQSPNKFLQKKIQKFLDESGSVDFKAQTKEVYGKIVFVNEEYERKSYLWKKCFRAGPYLTKIAQDFFKDWLTNIK